MSISMHCFPIFVVFGAATLASITAPAADSTIRYEGPGGMTAAVAIGEDMFIGACLADNVLRVYRTTGSSKPLASFDLSEYLEVAPELPVVIAGATRVGDRIYWITSHGRGEAGRVRPERYRFFATTVVTRDGQVVIEPVGTPDKTLVHKLVDRHTIRTLRLDKATRFGPELAEDERRRIAPSREGLNISALCASLNAEVLIAFRNPRPLRVITGTRHALVVPLDNAAEVIERGEAPIWGEGILWDLERMGVVSFAYSAFHRRFFFIAAPHDNDDSFVLYRWSGMKANPPEVVQRFSSDSLGLFPGTIVSFEGSEKLLLLGRGVSGPRSGTVASEGSERDSGRAEVSCGYWFQP